MKVHSTKANEQYNTAALINSNETGKKSQEKISKRIEELELGRRNWENITNIIKETAEEEVGKKEVSKQRNHNKYKSCVKNRKR